MKSRQVSRGAENTKILLQGHSLDCLRQRVVRIHSDLREVAFRVKRTVVVKVNYCCIHQDVNSDTQNITNN